MRHVAGVLILSLISTPVHAQQATCKLQAIEKQAVDKKLSGQALTNFMEKCADDAQKACEQLPLVRRLEEPGRTLFIATCVKGFVG
jgi:hypothetical protein